MDPRTKRTYAEILGHELVGAMRDDGKSYLGSLISQNRETFSMSLDRYSGEVFVVQTTPPSKDNKVLFWGRCAKAQPKF